MKIIKNSTISLVVYSALVSPYSQGATIVIDDANFGTDSVLRDVTNSRDFLRLDLTMGYGYNGIISQTGVGGLFEGWSVANSSNLLDLGSSSGIIPRSFDPIQLSLAEDIRDWFCPTGTCLRITANGSHARGLITDGRQSANGAPSRGAFQIGLINDIFIGETVVEFKINGFAGLTDKTEEVWLTRTSVVPLPASVWLFGSGLIGLIGLSRSKIRGLEN